MHIPTILLLVWALIEGYFHFILHQSGNICIWLRNNQLPVAQNFTSFFAIHIKITFPAIFFSLAVNRKRSLKPDRSIELPSPKQICLAGPTAVTSPKEQQSPVSICAPAKIFTPRHSHGQIVTLPTGQNIMFTTAPGPGQVGGAVSLVQTGSNSQPTLIQTPTSTVLPTVNGGTPVSILQAASAAATPNKAPSFIPMTANGISLSNGHTPHAPMNVIQSMAGGQAIRLISPVPSQLTNVSTHQQHHGQPLRVINASALHLEQHHSKPLPITTSTVVKRVSPSPPATTVHSSHGEKTRQFRHSLSSTTSSPPPLVQVIKAETDIISHKSSSPPPPSSLPPHVQPLMTINTVQQQNMKPAFEATAINPSAPQTIPMQSLLVPTTLQQQQQPMGRILLIAAADGTGGLDTNGGGPATLFPLRTLVEAPTAAFAQNSSFGLPIQILKVASNSITTN